MTYRQKVSDVALEYQNASKERKKQLPYAVINDLRKQGYRFLEESNEGVWKEVELTRIVMKVKHYLRDKGRVKKPKGTKRKAGELTAVTENLANNANETTVSPAPRVIEPAETTIPVTADVKTDPEIALTAEQAMDGEQRQDRHGIRFICYLRSCLSI